MTKFIQIFLEAFPKCFLSAIEVTIPMTILSFGFGLVIALFTALVQIANIKVLKQIARFYVWIIRCTPLLLQLMLAYFGLPNIGIVLDPFPCAVMVFSISVGAYCSETLRGAIESVPKGQMEAGYCVGMNYWQIMFRIILPQALKAAFPPLSNSLIGLVKDTSLAYSIAIVEVMATSNRIAARTYQFLTCYIAAGAVYLIICTVLTWIQYRLEAGLERMS